MRATNCIHELISTKVPYTWIEEHVHNNPFLALAAVKGMISKHILNNHFDPDKQTTLIMIWDAIVIII